MHDAALLVIWFSVNIGGMILTMFIPHIFSEVPKTEGLQDHVARVQSGEGRQEQGALVGELGQAA